MEKFKSNLLIFVLLAVLLSSCHYYKIRTIKANGDNEKIAFEVQKQRNYVNMYVVHIDSNIWQLNNPIISKSKIEGSLKEFSGIPKFYYDNVNDDWTSISKYKLENRKYVHQVHFYIDEFNIVDNKVSIQFNKIAKIKVLKNAPLLSFLAGTSVVAGSFTGAVLVVALIACNCPHTYVFNGENYLFNNTLFTGAASPKLERNDFKQMPDYFPSSSIYNIKIKNDEEEIQFTNLLELIVVDHDTLVEVFSDQRGEIYSINSIEKPITCIDNNNVDLLPKLSENDGEAHLFDTQTSDNLAQVYATFPKHSSSDNVKLILKAKNNPWAAFVYKEFSKKFGTYYDNWVKINHKKSKEEVLSNLKEAGVPLVISIKKGNKWIDVESIDLIGDINYNTLVVPINKKYFEGIEGNLEIRISSGFLFWNLDYVGIDYSKSETMNIQYIKPTIAVGNDSTDYKLSLEKDDDLYMTHLKTGDSTVIEFSGIHVNPDKERTVLLHSKGYYLPQHKYTEKPKWAELVKFREEGALSIFSKSLFFEYYQELNTQSNENSK